jgi:hypothetical protein
MGPLGDARGSPGWTRTSNPSVNSRMLCQLSYRGMLQGRLYGPRMGASRFDGDGAKRVFKGLYLGMESYFLVQVVRSSFVALAAEDNESQESLAH